MYHITTLFRLDSKRLYLKKYEKVKKKNHKENSLIRVLDLVFRLLNTLYL